MNTPAKTADRSARSSASASSLLTNVERDWMLSLDESELTAFLRSIPPASRPALLCELRDHKTPLERAETSLHEFVKQAWPHVESRVDFVDNWHIAALCRHLEAVTHGEIPQLLINVPPGCMKSLLCAVFWPAWVWGPCRQPDMRWLFISYAQPLSTRDAVRARRLIESTWYQERWGHVFTFVDDQNQKVRYETNRGGWRVSTSNGGIGTGEHPDLLVADDFFNAEQCDSDIARQNGLDWWDGTTTTRGISRNVRRVAIGQRFHEEDLSGHLLAEGGWDHICLPMEFEPGRMPPTSIGWTDPRTEPGELLWPAIFSEDRVRDLTRKLRPHRAAGQLQQNPTAREGELFKRSWFQTIDLYELPMSIFSGRPSRPLLGQSRHRRRRRVHGRRADGPLRPDLVRAPRRPRPMGGPRPRDEDHRNHHVRRHPLGVLFGLARTRTGQRRQRVGRNHHPRPGRLRGPHRTRHRLEANPLGTVGGATRSGQHPPDQGRVESGVHRRALLGASRKIQRPD